MEVAWNGIRYTAPEHWELSRIGRNDILMEDGGKPALEIKWSVAPARFAPERLVRRLSSGRTGGKSVKAQPEKMPKRWSAALEAFRTYGFGWQHADGGAKGVIAQCRRCGKISIIQFFFSPDRALDAAAAHDLLSSFADHPEDDCVLWAVFDIRAELPASYRLTHHRFRPGAFELAFTDKHAQLRLLRWAAAPVLAKYASLEEAARALLPIPAKAPARPEKTVLEWTQAPKAGWLSRIRRRGFAHQIIRMWMDDRAGRILGVDLRARRPVSPDLADRIARGFRSREMGLDIH